MAYSFSFATTQSIATSVGDNPPFGVSGSFAMRGFFTGGSVLSFIGFYNTSPSNSTRNIRYFPPGNSTIQWNEGNSVGNQWSFPFGASGIMPASQWRTVVASRTSNSAQALYTDAGSYTGNLGISNTQPVDVFRVGPFNGRAAEVAVWSVPLTDDEATSLIRGFKPTRIRPQSLLLYAPLVRTVYDYKENRTLNNNNSATVIEHPRVY